MLCVINVTSYMLTAVQPYVCVLTHAANHLQNTHNHASIKDIWMLGIRNQCVCYIPYNLVFACDDLTL